MARLPVYENEQNLGLGSVVQYPTLTRTANALANFGGELVEFGKSMQADEDRAANQIDARQKSLDNLRLQSELYGHEDRVRAYADEQAVSLLGEGSDGQGYTKSVAEFAQKDREATISKKFANREDAEEVALRFDNSSRGVLVKAGTDELNTGLKFQSAITEKTLLGLATKIGESAENYDAAATEWVGFVTSTNVDRPKLQERMAVIGLEKLQRARLESYAANNPEEFRKNSDGVFLDTPMADQPQHIKDVVKGATDQGVDPRTMLAIYEMESRMNPNAGMPRNRDGTPMSSAEGGFQVLSARDTLEELGISKQDKFDNAVVAPALAAYIKRKTEYMATRGVNLTPGQQYMFWNVGPGIAQAVIESDPRTPMSEIVNRTLARRSPEFRETVMRNNPSLYREGMTAGQVVASFDENMRQASARADKKVSGTSIDADGAAHKFFETLFPGGAPLLGAKDLGEVQVLARQKSSELSREQQSLNLGASIATGSVKVDARDSGNQKAVNEFVLKQNLTVGLVEGDIGAHNVAAKVTANAGFIPDAFVNAYSSAMAGGDIKSKYATYVALTDLYTQNPAALDASKIPADDKARVNEYIALTTVSNLSPDDAIQRIDFYRTPEGKKQADAQKAGLQTSKSAEVKSLSEADIITHFDAPWTSSKPTDTEGRFIAAATSAYQEQYVFHRERGKGPDEAKAMALSDLDTNWGSSRVADVGSGANTQTFMPYPPEKIFKQTDEGHAWITGQAKNSAVTFLEERYPSLVADYAKSAKENAQTPTLAKKLRTDIGVKLVPDLQTAQERRSGRPVGYRLLVRLPDGNTDLATERFFPDQLQADREAADRFKKGNRNARTPADDNALDGIAFSP